MLCFIDDGVHAVVGFNFLTARSHLRGHDFRDVFLLRRILHEGVEHRIFLHIPGAEPALHQRALTVEHGLLHRQLHQLVLYRTQVRAHQLLRALQGHDGFGAVQHVKHAQPGRSDARTRQQRDDQRRRQQYCRIILLFHIPFLQSVQRGTQPEVKVLVNLAKGALPIRSLHPSSSSSSALSLRFARAIRDFTVPSGMRRMLAISRTR